MFCPNCGGKLNKDTKFCPECGAKITDSQGNIPKEQRPTGEDPEVSEKKTKRNSLFKYAGPVVFIAIILIAYQLFFKNEQVNLPENPHEFTEEQIASLGIYNLSEIDTMSSGKLDGQWIVVTGVHSFQGADDETMMLPALADGTSTFTEIYYYSPQDFSLACFAMAFDETTVLGKCSYVDHNYSITDAILLTNDTLKPMLTEDNSTASENQTNFENSTERPGDEYDISITGEQLIEEANANMARMIDTYAGKRVKITDLEIIYVDAESAWFDTVQSIYFRNSEDLYSVNKGSRVTVVGSIAESFGSYCITDAVLLTDETAADHSGNILDEEDSENSNHQDVTDAYEAGKAAAWEVYNTIFQYGYDCDKIVTFHNSDDPQADEMAAGFFDEAVLMIGYTPYGAYTYDANILSGGDYTVFLAQWSAAEIVGVYIPSTDQEELDSLLPYLTLQANQLGYQNVYFFDGEGNDITLTMEELESIYA